MTTTIRPAGPCDADFIAWVILSAQRGHRRRGWFDIALDRPEGECLAFVRQLSAVPTRSWWHVSRFLIAEVDGVAAAALCALPAADTRGTAGPAIEEAANTAGMSAAERAAIWRRGAYTRACWMQGDDGNWFIEHVATWPSHRGRGLVLALLDHALGQGKARGFNRASISFYIGNEPAERCYARAGFAFAEEKRDPAFEALTGAPGFRRFEKAL